MPQVWSSGLMESMSAFVQTERDARAEGCFGSRHDDMFVQLVLRLAMLRMLSSTFIGLSKRSKPGPWQTCTVISILLLDIQLMLYT